VVATLAQHNRAIQPKKRKHHEKNRPVKRPRGAFASGNIGQAALAFVAIMASKAM
jgi:hypothetical protein